MVHLNIEYWILNVEYSEKVEVEIEKFKVEARGNEMTEKLSRRRMKVVYILIVGIHAGQRAFSHHSGVTEGSDMVDDGK